MRVYWAIGTYAKAKKKEYLMLRKRDFNKIKFEKQLKKTNVVQENVLDMRKKNVVEKTLYF